MNKVLLFLCIFICSLKIINAQQEVSTKKVIIGLKIAPPFVEKSHTGFRGLSVDSWQLVNSVLEWKYEYKLYNSLPELMDAIEKREVDFSINPITVTEERAVKYDFTQPYFISNTVMARKDQSSVWNTFLNLWSWRFISAVGILIGVIFIFGFLIWIFERKKNKEQFGVGKWKGIGQAFWWSAVTMTTVGYGDKAPQTTMGRFIGIIWMFIAVVTISSLTAGIASSLTVQNLNEEIKSVNDLSKFKVETVEDSSSADYLQSYRIDYLPVSSVKQGILNLKNEASQIFVYDEPLMLYEIEQLGLKKEIQTIPYILRKDYFGYCFPKDSKLVSQVNPVLISSLKTLDWMTLIKKYQNQ
ncbi:transporter substrate-binding domain-containing protein [Weeksellaceae bacterium TAE3-ERU29]|nr:transporter substrate-binding domain-containing protein [Weeksellaceae bacterium TAE3-ERU29]